MEPDQVEPVRDDAQPKKTRPAKPEDFTCPKCKSSESTYFAEYVFRGIKLKEIKDGVAIFDTSWDEMIWEDSKDQHLCCKACGEEWPLPPDVEIDFE